VKKKTAVKEGVRETSKDAPHQDTPLWIARNRIRADESWSLDTIFPEVMEEDRTSKLKDLATAQAVGSITHRRMSEQMAKELGFDDYNYDAEIDEIEKEQQELPPGLLGVADQIGQSVTGLGKGAGMGGGSISIGAPAPGIAAEQEGPLYPKKYFGTNDGTGSRDALSGAATSKFRKMQRSDSGMERERGGHR
jgi:hypothetical protein